MKKFTLVIVLGLALLPFGFAQTQTIRMMQYNLLYYTEQTVYGCNQTTNNLTVKDNALRTIIDYVVPDVLVVNEIGSNVSYANRIVNNVLNTNGRNGYLHCPLTNYSGGSIANMLFYNSAKLAYHSHFYIATVNRDINGYKMYYLTPNLAQGDTIFTTFILAHLKAGTGSENEQKRYSQVAQLMSKLESLGEYGNYCLSGDFNLYGASENAYQHLIHYPNSLYKFYDPINMEGEWNSNYSYRSIHTQSTHKDDNDCASAGGLDDRFDFILVSPYILYGSQKVQSINSSYHAVGQDGNRYNGDVNSPYNNAVPEEIAEALYTMSDHLPVVLDFNIKTTTGIDEYVSSHSVLANVVNPVRDNKLELNIFSDNERALTFRLYTTDGRLITTFAEPVHEGENRITKEFPYSPSLYFLQILDGQKQVITKKIAKF